MKHRINYCKRTLKHIHKVHFNMLHIIEYGENLLKRFNVDSRSLMYQVMKHDRSKFNDVQFFAYADYFNGTQPPSDTTKKEFQLACENHKHNENHHFEGQRYMRPENIIEMVCDWQAMAQEFGEGTCEKYYNEKWTKQYLDYYKVAGFSQGYAGNYTDDYEYSMMETIISECIAIFKKHPIAEDR